MPFFLVIAASLAESANGTVRNTNTFRSLQTLDGRYVCAHNSLIEFPDLFKGRRVTLVELEETDFPAELPEVPLL
ncbi:hypothetical protein DNI29_04515 [Hymenobacter sediminis]|uniref:hypothetical protein n=1 Tax=Hymenobacter sediminis TaxID=2218621 RepID=UPI000DA6B9F7|nr:hypothetical protein [Hymenobacter sediminis]RPD50066.1 hypothetical protein DNI29_04515 [Hymenobacter sediminis]